MLLTSVYHVVSRRADYTRTTSGWRGYRQQSMPEGWKAVDGALTRVSTATDILTIDEFGDFELTVDWNLSAGGNSGVLYRLH